ncbi:MAG: phosphate ABC transporter permease subunit PstC [Candidatus Omnitrophica bacterium CG11_big_fil_rev_8_21_14_0_20_42_13]|uniref:Phosphate transport system permease protein n=1 Tax=Candidatus Ghiorseimicrobium undicola TaxID=1974746 RepID=A0A2H0LXZ1_9BACT|nr:MAG: phosphate ABC transporter permease subunit PstC [Candidatus Omnitrophica bacterium CG11_big_fil_rev_8_21_14_0_20_42_13]
MKIKSADLWFKKAAAILALSAAALVILLVCSMAYYALPAIRKFGLHFLHTSTWDPVKEIFGALPFIYGTVISSALALLMALPVSLGIAVYLAELAPCCLREPLSFLIELLAAIPSVVYGLWGIFFLAPFLRETVQPFLFRYFGFLPLFQGEFYGVGMLSAAIILSIMIIPTISSISREVFLTVPSAQREAALALGATRWETIRLAVLGYARSGVLGAVILGLGRALGETMAVTMVIGNRPEISGSLFAPAYTMASVIANEFSEATTDLYLSALIEIGFILFFVTLIINIAARALIWRVSAKIKAK